MKAPARQMKRKQLQKQLKTAPQIPVNTEESNARGDRMSLALFIALLVISLLTFAGGVYWSTTNFVNALNRTPMDWNTMILMTLALSASVMVARSLLWLSYFGTVMLSARMGAWKTCEATCKRAIKLPKSLSRGSAWASVALVQSLVGRGKYDEALAAANEEWQRSSADAREAQNLGPLCVTAGMASQVKEDMKESLSWNERAIDCLNKAMEELSKPKKGIIGKAMAPQSAEWTGQFRTQLAVAHFNIAGIYFNKQDFRRAKENFKKAVDHATQAPDFHQKSDIIKHGRDQLGRLKHH